jgi:hypothetical protein
MKKDVLLSDPCKLTTMMPPEHWKSWLKESWEVKQKTEVDLIKECTRTGRPAGNNAFINSLEKKTGRILRARVVGRPLRKNEGPVLFS